MSDSGTISMAQTFMKIENKIKAKLKTHFRAHVMVILVYLAWRTTCQFTSRLKLLTLPVVGHTGFLFPFRWSDLLR